MSAPFQEIDVRLENGDQYKGRIENSKFHGEGVYIFKEGDTFSGTYNQGKVSYYSYMSINIYK